MNPADPGAADAAAAHIPVSAESGLPIGELEAVYDLLAEAIDRVGPERSELLLVKLALVQAQAVGSAQRFGQHLDEALRDL